MNDGTMPQPVTASSLITDEEKKYFEQQANVELSQHQTFYRWMKHLFVMLL